MTAAESGTRNPVTDQSVPPAGAMRTAAADSGWIGKRVRRKEDPRLLTGRGSFVGDVKVKGMLHAVFVHSPYAHARIRSIDVSAALDLPGVVDVITGAEIKEHIPPVPNNLAPPYDTTLRDYGIAAEKVKYAAEPVAFVVAETAYIAADAIDLIEVDYESLTPILDPEEAIKPGATLVHDDAPDNRPWFRTFVYGDVEGAFAEADLVVSSKYHFRRSVAAPLECWAVLADWDESEGELTVWTNSSRPGREVFLLASTFGLSPEAVRVRCQDVGGSFGNKNNMHPYILMIAYAARKLGRPIQWLQTRTELLESGNHGCEHIFDGEMALRRDGQILAVRERMVADEGAEMRSEPRGASNWIRQCSNVYTFQNLQVEVSAVVTNKCPANSMRSYGKQQYSFLIESLIEKAALELGMDPADIRRRNLVQKEQMPFKIPSGSLLDGGDYPAMLEMALDMVGYDGWRAQQAEARKEGRYIGIGIAFATEAYGGQKGQDSQWTPGTKSGDIGAAMLRVDAEGRLSVSVDSRSTGLGHETTAAQIVADILGVTPDDVRVAPGFDSTQSAYGERHSGSYASRFAVVHHGALMKGAQAMAEKIKRLSTLLLDVPIEMLELRDGRVFVRGSDRSVSLREVGHLAWNNSGIIPDDWEGGLVVHYVYHAPLPPLESVENGYGIFSMSYTPGVSVAVIEIDAETGAPSVLRYVSVEDPGTCINPMICEGMVHGQVGHQLAAALYERLDWDEDGHIVNGTFKDYLVPTAADLPNIESALIETPSLFAPLGTRGMAEGGGAPLIAAINAIRDALQPLGVDITESHVSPADLFQWINGSAPATVDAGVAP